MAKLNITLGAAALATVIALPMHAEETAPEQVSVPENATVVRTEEDERDAANEEESDLFEASLSLSFMSAYVCNDRIFSDTPVAQYDVWLQANMPEDFGWFAFDIWANQELNKRHSSVENGNGGRRFGGLGEFDYELVYGNKLGPVEVTASHLWWTYPRCGLHSQEFWTFGVKYENQFLTPSAKLFWEYGHIHNEQKPDDCLMIDLALSHKWEICTDLSLTFTSKTTLYTKSYAEYLSGKEITRACFGGWDNGLALSYKLNDYIKIGASLNFLYKIDHSVRHCPEWDNYSPESGHSTRNGLLYGGVSMCVEF